MTTIVKCQCGNDKAEHNGILLCGHCDTGACIADPAKCDAGHDRHPRNCAHCSAYSTAVNLRVISEYDQERKRG
ncbi:MAG: hypothetical protein ACTHJM_16115 [Marmoricola sp.]